MGSPRSFELFEPGDVVEGPSVSITDEHLRTVRELGGYVHPLFSDSDFLARSRFTAQPVPAQWSLFLLGGLAEQTGAFGEDVVALIGIHQARFHRPVLIGDTLRLEMEVLGKRVLDDGLRGIVELRWMGINQRSEVAVECEVAMLFDVHSGGG